jgi:hypothetical protein
MDFTFQTDFWTSIYPTSLLFINFEIQNRDLYIFKTMKICTLNCGCYIVQLIWILVCNGTLRLLLLTTETWWKSLLGRRGVWDSKNPHHRIELHYVASYFALETRMITSFFTVLEHREFYRISQHNVIGFHSTMAQAFAALQASNEQWQPKVLQAMRSEGQWKSKLQHDCESRCVL